MTLQIKSKKMSCPFSEWKGRGLPDATLGFYLASVIYFISFDLLYIENDSMHSADSTEWKLFFIFCRFQMTYIVKYVNAGSGRRTNSTPAGSVKGCSTESVSWASQMYTHPTHPPSNEPASK